MSTSSPASAPRKNAAALAEAQSDLEMFDVVLAPGDDFDIFRDGPMPTGETKPRALVHRDADWHRSVHVWLIDRATQKVALQKRSAKKVRRGDASVRLSRRRRRRRRRRRPLPRPLSANRIVRRGPRGSTSRLDSRLPVAHPSTRGDRQDTFPNLWDISAAGHIESGHDSRDTAVRELEEELGIACLHDELSFAFCVPAEQAHLGGCNCFEDVYFLERDETVDMAPGEAEVSGVMWMDVRELRDAWRRDDGDVVPRSAQYVDAFASHLEKHYGPREAGGGGDAR